ncbi:MAG: aminopeptidase P family protein [Saprospiraceae bacterium]|nr:aminopeptidase P family protein [Saprospiraceae bacterium]
MNLHLFSPETYHKRRESLVKGMKSGLIWILGNDESPKNYEDNTYHFRQDSNFLYFAGISLPGLSLLIDIDAGKTYLCGDDRSVEMVVWMGPLPGINELGQQVGIAHTLSTQQLQDKLKEAADKDRTVHYLPPYRGLSKIKLAKYLQKSIAEVERHISLELIKSVIRQRSVKESQELEEMDKALTITRDMHLEVMYEAKPGVAESTLVSYLMSAAHKQGVDTAYPVILTKDGQTLHNHDHHHVLEAGQLLLGDFGAESPMFYAGDITRTLPVSGSFTPLQKSIYELVLAGQNTAIAMLEPGRSYRDIHLACALTMASGLKDLGLMQGDMEDAVNQGAHALFFPHGLGHMIGLDVHDMEDLGEDLVGYDTDIGRSKQFGLRSLRYGKNLHEGLVLTVEPGLYFIPQLIGLWSSEKKHVDFINYSALSKFQDFGGIRIEDNYVITSGGSRLLGPPIPKKVEEVEFLMAANRPL